MRRLSAMACRAIQPSEGGPLHQRESLEVTIEFFGRSMHATDSTAQVDARSCSVLDYDIARQRRRAGRRETIMRRLLERVRQGDQPRLAERAARERHTRLPVP